MSDIAIRVEGLGKKYRIGERQASYGSLRDSVAETFAKPFRAARSLVTRNGNANVNLTSDPRTLSSDFWALKDVSFDVRRGEVVGIIGRNGAGKSTLLKILSRITEPTEGAADIYGRVGSLLEVGTGFHPELTGRENIFLNGSIIGMKREEIKKKFDEIVAFAEIEKFIDTPVKHYSSGMYVRLAFAVAAHLEPEILLIDEVLAVGDAAFQKKCLGKMGDVAKEGLTVLFVSHNMQAIRQLCNRAILLEDGRLSINDESGPVIERYLHDVSEGSSLVEVTRKVNQLPADPAFRLHSIDVVQAGHSRTELISGESVKIVIEYDVLQVVSGFLVYFELRDSDDIFLFESFHNGDALDLPTVYPGRYISCATIPANFLAGRKYELRVSAAIHGIRECIPKTSSLRIGLNVTSVGYVNRAYPGYITPGRIAPLIPWQTRNVCE